MSDSTLASQEVVDTAVNEQDILFLFNSVRTRFSERDARWDLMSRVVRGEVSPDGPDGETLQAESTNIIQIALEDIGESAGSMPTVRVQPMKGGSRGKAQAAAMEQIGTGYLEISDAEALIPRTIMDMAAYGLGVWTVWPDFEERLPMIEKRSALECYPDPNLRQDGTLNRCMFIREVRYKQLPPEYQAKIALFNQTTEPLGKESRVVHLVEVFTTTEYVVAALYQTVSTLYGQQSSNKNFTPIILDRWTHDLDMCPVVIGSRFSLDGEYRGQFDQVVGPLMAYARLMALTLDYADQAVYSDIWVKDLIGEMSFGGGAYIELGPQGAIGRVPPAVNSLNIQQDIQHLEDSIHTAARWPKQRTGEVDQAIASAKFVESTVGVLNTALRTYHLRLKQMIERSLRVCYTIDKKYFPGPKSAAGVMDNQQFLTQYDPSKDIDTMHRVRAEYGLGLGRDPSQSAILMLQYSQAGIISKDFVQENIDGLVDVERERRRLDTTELRAMLKAKLLQGVQDGSIPGAALVAIISAREDGEDLTQLYQKYVVEPQANAPFTGVPPAAPQGGLAPGAPPGGPPGPPGPPGVPGQGPGVMPPPAPDMVQAMSRLSTPLTGGTGFLRTATNSGPPAGP